MNFDSLGVGRALRDGERLRGPAERSEVDGGAHVRGLQKGNPQVICQGQLRVSSCGGGRVRTHARLLEDIVVGMASHRLERVAVRAVR